MVLTLIACSAVLGHFLTITQIPQFAGDWLVALHLPRVLIMVIVFLFYLLGGSFIDDLAFMILVTPILFPAVQKLGYDPLWFGVMIGVTLMVGTIIPPVAISVFVVKNITGESFKTVYAGVVPFLASFVVVGALLFLFPGIATWLPACFWKAWKSSSVALMSFGLASGSHDQLGTAALGALVGVGVMSIIGAAVARPLLEYPRIT